MTTKPGVAIGSLTANRDELLEGLLRLKRHVKKKKAGPGTFRFQDGELRVEVEGMEITARGVGKWAGEAVVPGAFVLALPSSAPAARSRAGAAARCRRIAGGYSAPSGPFRCTGPVR